MILNKKSYSYKEMNEDMEKNFADKSELNEEDNERKCNGECLLQMGTCTYYRKISCPYDCKPIKCPNYLLCGQAWPQMYLWCHSNRCIYCNQTFGCDLIFIEKDQECCICFNEKSTFIRWGCIHELCVDCFRLNHGWTEDFLQGPDDSRLKVHTEEDFLRYEQECDTYDLEHPREIILDENGWEVESPPVVRGEWIGKCPLCRNEEIPSWKKKFVKR